MDGDKWMNVWMGYTFEKIPGFENDIFCGQIRKITGLYDVPDRVGKEIIKTDLSGTIILFTNHLRYMKKELRPTPELISQLFDMASGR